MAIDLTNLVCLVTGADEGIGKGLVLGFLKRGAKVAAGLLHADQSAAAIQPALPLQMDVTRPDQIKAAVEKTIKAFGRIDVLINNAGIYPRKHASELKFEHWRQVLDLNLDGAFLCCEAVIPHMIKQKSGSIINVGSVCFSLGLPFMAHYEASKGGLVGMTHGMCRDLGPHGIRVNCIHPGAVLTEGEMRSYEGKMGEEELAAETKQQSIPGRITPASIEPVFAFLASSESGDITGQSLIVDRGWLLS